MDGHPETIRYFDKDNDPLTLRASRRYQRLGAMRSTTNGPPAEAFLNQMMTAPADRTPDRAFLIHWPVGRSCWISPSSSPRLHEALDQVGTSSPDESRNDQNSNGGNCGYGRHGDITAAEATLYDAIFLASDSLMQKQHGRKALVVLTDGEDRGSMATLARAIAAAQRAETVVYAIHFKSEQHGYGGHDGGGYGGRGSSRWRPAGAANHPDGKKVLEQITGETGGRMSRLAGQQTFTTIYTQFQSFGSQSPWLHARRRHGSRRVSPHRPYCAEGQKADCADTRRLLHRELNLVTCVCARRTESPQEAYRLKRACIYRMVAHQVGFDDRRDRIGTYRQGLRTSRRNERRMGRNDFPDFRHERRTPRQE